MAYQYQNRVTLPGINNKKQFIMLLLCQGIDGENIQFYIYNTIEQRQLHTGRVAAMKDGRLENPSLL